MAGSYLMPRGWLDDEMFQSPKREPYCHRAAWAWLIEHAAFQPASVKGVPLARGQLLASIQDMVGAWGWNTTKVARFMSALRERSLIVTATVRAGTIITICFYDDYQSFEKSTVTATDMGVGVTVSIDRHGEELKNEVTKESEANASDIVDPRGVALAMMAVWKSELGDTLSVPSKINASRLSACRRRLADSFADDMDRWRAYCRAIRGSPFLCGAKGWKADFDWALKPENITHVEEGRYEAVNGRYPGQSTHDSIIRAFDIASR